MFNKFQLGTRPATLLASNKLSSDAALVLLKMMYKINRVNMVIEYMLNPDIMFNGNDRQYFIVKHMWDTQTSTGLRT